MKNRKEYMEQYYQNHKEEIDEYQKQYCQDHKKERNEYSKQWRKDNHEYALEYRKQWKKEHPDNVLEYQKKWAKTEKGKATSQRGQNKRRTILKEIINTLTAEEWLDILEKHNYRCAYCGIEFDCENLPTRDHIIPISKGGNNTKDNIVPACKSCNAKKYNKILN